MADQIDEKMKKLKKKPRQMCEKMKQYTRMETKEEDGLPLSE